MCFFKNRFLFVFGINWVQMSHAGIERGFAVCHAAPTLLREA